MYVLFLKREEALDSCVQKEINYVAHFFRWMTIGSRLDILYLDYVINCFFVLCHCRLTETARLLRNVFSRSMTRMQGAAPEQQLREYCHLVRSLNFPCRRM